MRRLTIVLLCAGVWSVPAQGQTAEEKQATISFLRGLQAPDGGFRPAPGGKTPSGLRATSAALRALKYFGGEPRDREASKRFVTSCFDKTSGGFADRPQGKPDTILTAVGLAAIVELEMPRENYLDPAIHYLTDHAKGFEEVRMAAAGLEAVGKRPAQADTWLEQLDKMRNSDGTFGKGSGVVRATGGATAAILRLGGKLANRAKVIQTLKNGQRPDGGYGKEDVAGSDLETSYRVVRSLVMLKEKSADVAKLRTFIARCRNADGGYGVTPGQPSTVGATYFAGTLLHWLSA